MSKKIKKGAEVNWMTSGRGGADCRALTGKVVAFVPREESIEETTMAAKYHEAIPPGILDVSSRNDRVVVRLTEIDGAEVEKLQVKVPKVSFLLEA